MQKTTHLILRALAISAMALFPLTCLANNLSISSVALVDTGGGEADIRFDMSWENSWHESWTENGGTTNITNWDAVWVFAKYRQNGGLWRHVQFTANGHTPTGGTVIDVPADRLGALVHRSATGSGTVTCTNMRLHWDLAAAGLPSADEIDLTVLGVEMVYIPEGAFHLGSGGTESSHFYTAPDTNSTYLINSEDEFTAGDAAGNLQAAAGLQFGLVPAAFPKGFAAFYCMKHEISEAQYVDFLNLLDPGIVTPFFPNAAGISRHTISLAAGGDYETTAPDRACSYMSADRLLTYFDWSGLRPMTELEFEKSCRGAKSPWIDEFAWGNATAITLTGFQGTDGSGTETAIPANSNTNVSGAGINGPVRTGIFATASSTRESAGAGYYGVLDLTGNLYEFVVSLYNIGPSYDGTHGDGDEYSTYTTHWSASNTYGYMAKGGSYANTEVDGRTSSRRLAESRSYANAGGNTGGRGVRTAP